MTTPDASTISVIIPTTNRSATIGKAIESIYNNTIAPREVIVVDQSRDDLTLNVLQKFIEAKGLIYIRDQGSGISRSRNVGWKRASGEIIAFTDDDAWVDSKWLECILEIFNNRAFNIGAVGGRILPVYEEKNPNWTIPKQWEYLLPSLDHGDAVTAFKENAFPIGVNLITYRHLLEEFDGFDENMGVNSTRSRQIFGEDVDYYLRLKNRGFDLVYNPHCIVYHPVPLSRQSQEFLNKRLMTEGTTYVYFMFKDGKLGPLKSAVLMLKSLVRYTLTLLKEGNKEEAHYLYAKIVMFIRIGLLRLEY